MSNMEAGLTASRTSLTVQKVYVPRVMSRTRTPPSQLPQPLDSRSSHFSQPSPGTQSYEGYNADLSEVDSVVGSVSSSIAFRQPLDPRALGMIDSGLDSGFGRRHDSYASTTSYVETDIDSTDGDRYKGELYQPQAAPRSIPIEFKRLKGECHPSKLQPDELPSMSSGDELETSSCASIPSFGDIPRPAPRASLRRKKVHHGSAVNDGFTSDDDSVRYSQSSQSLPRGILKINSMSTTTDISDAESMDTGERFVRQGSKRQSKVRFEAVRKGQESARKVIQHNDDELDSKSKKKKISDPWAIMSGPTIKPARNDPRRSSDRSQRSSTSQRRSSRSSSHDRGSRSSGRNSSTRRSSSQHSHQRLSSTERPRTSPTESKFNGGILGSLKSNSRPRTPSQDRHSTRSHGMDSELLTSTDKQRVSMNASTDHVTIQIKDQELPKRTDTEKGSSRSKPKSKPENRSVLRNLMNSSGQTDKQKILKWALIVGVPTVLLIVVVIVIVLALSSG